MSDDIALRGRWITVFSNLRPSTLSVLSLDIEPQSVLFLSDNLLEGVESDVLHTLFGNRVMVLSMTPNFADAQKFLQLGAMGYGNAMMHESHLRSAYQALSEGKVWLHPDFIGMIMAHIRSDANVRKSAQQVLDVLSKREQEVAVMLGEGSTHQEIADSLDITIRTVKAHAASIYQKLKVKDRLALSLLLHT